MRILLQHVPTKRYFRACEVWTDAPGEAFNFQHSQRAIDYAADHHLTDVQLIVRFPDEEVLAVPLPIQTLPLDLSAAA